MKIGNFSHMICIIQALISYILRMLEKYEQSNSHINLDHRKERNPEENAQRQSVSSWTQSLLIEKKSHGHMKRWSKAQWGVRTVVHPLNM